MRVWMDSEMRMHSLTSVSVIPVVFMFLAMVVRYKQCTRLECLFLSPESCV